MHLCRLLCKVQGVKFVAVVVDGKLLSFSSPTIHNLPALSVCTRVRARAQLQGNVFRAANHKHLPRLCFVGQLAKAALSLSTLLDKSEVYGCGFIFILGLDDHTATSLIARGRLVGAVFDTSSTGEECSDSC
jgi:hypothetical protein